MDGRLRFCLCIVVLSICRPAAMAAEQSAPVKRLLPLRRWTDAVGLFPFEARLIGYGDGVVRLRQKDRTLLRIPIGRLSTWDQQYVREHDGSIPAAPADVKRAAFSMDRLKKMLFGDNERARQEALTVIARQHSGDAEATALLLEFVAAVDPRTEPTSNELTAIRLLAYDDSLAVTAALLKLFGKVVDAEVSEYTVAVAAALQGHKLSEVDEAVRPLLESRDYRLVMLAAHLLGSRRDGKSFERIIALADHEKFDSHFGFRQAVFQAVAHYRNRQSVKFFVEQLPTLDGELKKYAVDCLRLTTDQSLGADSAAWTAWWKGSGEQFLYYPVETPDRERSPGDDYTWDQKVPKFYGHQIYAKRIIFVIDCSSTMSKSLGRGRIKLDEAKRQLAGAIMDLPTDAEFNVVYFNSTVDTFSSKMIVVTPETRQWAVEKVASLQWMRGTAIFDALDVAFRMDDNVEAFYLVSDGQPTVGVTDPDEILRQAAAANTFRFIRINTVGIGDDWKRFMQPLAQRNFGVYRHAR